MLVTDRDIPTLRANRAAYESAQEGLELETPVDVNDPLAASVG